MKATDRAATGASSATRLALATLAAACMAGAQAQPVAANPAAAGARPIYDGHLCCNMRTDGSWISDSNYAEGGKRVIPAGTLVKVTGYGRQRVQVTVDGKQVLQSVGYPISSENPKSDANVWRMWLSSSAEFQVLFDERGQVA